MGSNPDNNLINSLNRGLTILDILLNKGPIGATEMGKYLNINKSSAYRLFATLEKWGFVEQDMVTLKYKLGLSFLKYNEKVLDGLDVREISRPYLKEIVERTRETAHLSVLHSTRVMIIDQEKGTEVVSVTTSIGDSEPLHCSAIGKAILAFLPQNKQEEIINNMEFKAYTHKTITGLEMFSLEIKKVLSNGYAIDDEELNPGVRCIAAPILNHKGKAVASIGVSGPISRIRMDNLKQYIDIVTSSAGSISNRLGYYESTNPDGNALSNI